MSDNALVLLDGDSEEVIAEIQGKKPEKLLAEFNKYLLGDTDAPHKK